MDFAEFRKKNKETAPKTAETSEPANSTVHGSEKEHQNKDLLKMKDDTGNKTVWIPRGPKIKAPGLTTESHHKVKIHFGNGKTETRIIDDEELGTIKRNAHVTKVTHLGRSKLNGDLLEYVLEEGDQAESVFKHKDGRVAHLATHKYKDPSLGTDHYVHLPDSRATVYSGDEGLGKAHKLLSKLGYALAVAESVQAISEVTVAVHKAYPGKVDAIKSDLHKFHSDNGSGIKSSEHGDYVHFHLPSKSHNTADSVQRTLKDHENHPAYSPENVTESYKAK